MTVGVCVLSNICKAYITTNMFVLFFTHPDWKPNGSVIDRKIKMDMEAGYQSGEFREFCHTLGYRIESSPTRDKHAHGVAERSVGNKGQHCHAGQHYSSDILVRCYPVCMPL